MQVEVDAKCMETKFGRHGPSSFGDFTPFSFAFKTTKISLWTIDYVYAGQKIESAQKIHASRGCCEMHANQIWWAWPIWFQRFCPFMFAFKNGQISISDHGL